MLLMRRTPFLLFLLLCNRALFAQNSIATQIEKAADRVEAKCIAWRRDIHQNPELGNRETRTAKLIANELRRMGIEVTEGVAHTGVVGILRGTKPGPVIGLRADMDALPITERTTVPFASKVKANYNGKEVGVMHACGHDTHVAVLLATAEILSGMRKDLAGTVKFIFQPAEEGSPAGEEGGAFLMVKEGVLENPKVEAMFGLHINSVVPVGQVTYREKGVMAAADWFHIVIKGKQTHGAQPWLGIDPVVIGAQIINSLQTIVSRQSELTKNAVVISTTMVTAGVRENILPEEVTLGGTIRTLDTAMQRDVLERVERTAKYIAEASGATATVSFEHKTLVTYNNPELMRQMLPSLVKATNSNVQEMDAQTSAEDYSYFAEKVPSLFLFFGGMQPGTNPKTAMPHHTPDFIIDEAGLKTAVKTFAFLVTDYMAQSVQQKSKKQF
jgi:amidohydrolase